MPFTVHGLSLMVLVYVVPQCVILEDVVTAQTLEKVKTCH